VPQILSRVEVFLFAESLGGAESLITFPAVQTHADVNPAIRERLGISDRLLRLSVGIEDAADLMEDFGAGHGVKQRSKDKMDYNTRILPHRKRQRPYTGAASIPIYQVSTFVQDDPVN